MTVPTEALWGIIGFLIVLFLAVIGWFIRKDYQNLTEGLRNVRELDLKNEREARAKDRHDLREEIAVEREMRHAFELRVVGEYPNMARMTEALVPLTKAIEDMRENLRELFELVHTKEDKHRGAD